MLLHERLHIVLVSGVASAMLYLRSTFWRSGSKAHERVVLPPFMCALQHPA